MRRWVETFSTNISAFLLPRSFRAAAEAHTLHSVARCRDVDVSILFVGVRVPRRGRVGAHGVVSFADARWRSSD